MLENMVQYLQEPSTTWIEHAGPGAGLDPGSMDLAQVEGPGSWVENYRLRAVLALQHLWSLASDVHESASVLQWN
jgi:hypothetical protein